MAAVKEKTNLLDIIPSRCSHITTGKEGDCTVIAFPRFRYVWMRRWLLPKGMSPDIHVRLDEHGAAVWELIDGRRTVRHIIEKLAAHFQQEVDYESRVIAYMYQLQKDGLISFLLPCPP